MDELMGLIEGVPVFSFKPNEGLVTWRNGFAVRLDGSANPAELVPRLAAVLDRFESWVIHDGLQECAVYANMSPSVEFFRQVKEFNRGSGFRIQQLFVRHREEDNALERISKIYKKVWFKPAMYFDDGRIYLIHTSEDKRVTWQRTQGFPGRLLGWAICDSDGQIFGDGGWIEL